MTVMEFLLIAHGCYTNQSELFKVPANCTINYYNEHGEPLTFDEGYWAARGLLIPDAMEMSEKTISTGGEILMDYSLTTYGLIPTWADLPINELGLFQIIEQPNGERQLYCRATNFTVKLSQVVKYIAEAFPNESILFNVLSCRMIYRLPDDMEIENW